MTSSRPPSGIVTYPNTGEPENSSGASFSNKQTMQQKMLRQRQLSLERQRNAAKSTFVGVKAQELPIRDGYGRPPSLPPRALNVNDAAAALEGAAENSGSSGAGGTCKISSASGHLDTHDKLDGHELPRCRTADSNISTFSVLLNDGSGRPGVADKPPACDVATWDLTVNAGTRPSGAVAASDATENGGKKWWKPSMPFRGNRSGSAEPPASRITDIDGVTTSEAVSFDRSGVRTPDSGERTFHGPGIKRSPMRGGYGRPPVPERRSPVQEIPGGIFDADVALSLRPPSAGSNAGRSSSVPARQHSPGPRRQPSPSRVAPMGAATVETEVSTFQSVDRGEPGPIQPEAPARNSSPSPLLGEEAAKKGGRRGWRPWRAQKETSNTCEAPKPEHELAASNEISPFVADD